MKTANQELKKQLIFYTEILSWGDSKMIKKKKQTKKNHPTQLSSPTYV